MMQILLSLYYHNGPQHWSFLEATVTLRSQGNLPVMTWGQWGGLAELCNGILSFCNIMECDEIPTCPPDYILHTSEDFFKDRIQPGSFPLLPLILQLALRGTAIVLCPYPISALCPFHMDQFLRLSFKGCPVLFGTLRAKQRELYSPHFCLCIPFNLSADFLLNPRFGHLCLLGHMKTFIPPVNLAALFQGEIYLLLKETAVS